MKKELILLLILMIGLLSAQNVLFDLTKDELAGNADWTIGSAPDYIGGFSDFGQALRNNNYNTDTLYGNSISASDLSGYDVFVIPEPQNPFSSQEVNAILDFVSNGGGLFIIADHDGADRNGNGWDAVRVFNESFNVSDNFGFQFDLNNEWFDPASYPDENHPINEGVNQIGIWAGSTISTTSAEEIFWADYNHSQTIVVTAEYGNGKIVAIGDSSPFDDGTGNPGNNLYDGFNDYDIPTFSVNIIDWLSDGNSNNVEFSGLAYTPNPILPNESFSVSLNVTSNYNVNYVYCYWNIGNGFNPIQMNNTGNMYQCEIPPQSEDAIVEVYFQASVNQSIYEYPVGGSANPFIIHIGEQSPIYEIQFTTDAGDGTFPSPFIGERKQVSGIVTANNFNGNTDNFFITEDGNGWNGIYVYSSGESPQIGDEVSFEATVDEYFGFTELKEISNFIVLSNENTITPTTITTADVNLENYEGCFVRIENVTVTQSLNDYGEFYVSDGSGECQIDDRIFSYTGDVEVGTGFMSIQGVIDYAYGNFAINPRFLEDFNAPVANSNETINKSNIVYPNPFNPHKSKLNFTEIVKSDETFSIYNLKGQKVYQSFPGENHWNGKNYNGTLCNSGIYFLKKNMKEEKPIKFILLR